MIWLTGLYFIHTMGEIALSPIGLSMVNKLSPLRFASLMMGIWYLSTATANKFAGMLSGLYPEDGKVEIPADAPPRSSDEAIWNVLSQKWVDTDGQHSGS